MTKGLFSDRECQSGTVPPSWVRASGSAHMATIEETGDSSPFGGKIVLNSAPKLGEVYWCSFHHDALKPEFHKRRPVMVASYRNHLSGPILVIPFSTLPQDGNPWAIRAGQIVPSDQRTSWAVCNHLYTVSCERLTPDRGRVPRIKGQLRAEILALARQWIADPVRGKSPY